jgi:quinol monooxygenase YgiN
MWPLSGHPKGITMLSHNVFFTLQDSSEKRCQELVAACHRFLAPHDGIVFYAAGTLTADLTREVNDHQFHVALNVVFKDRPAHDAYQDSPKHHEFIASNKDNWARVRVFDSDVAGAD